MKKFKCDLEGKLNIKFEDEEKVLKYFTSEEWEKVFYTFGDLMEISEHLANDFHYTEIDYEHDTKTATYKYYKFIEGFGKFYDYGNEWICEEKEFGKIIINYEAVEVTWIAEII
jgi:hypothetical protein